MHRCHQDNAGVGWFRHDPQTLKVCVVPRVSRCATFITVTPERGSVSWTVLSLQLGRDGGFGLVHTLSHMSSRC